MDTFQNIMNRRNIRHYSNKPISDDALDTILKAGMAGPSCVNARDWSFIVTRDPEILEKMSNANGKPADPLKQAKLGIMVLGDLERAFKYAPDYWIIDGAIAAQNMILAANSIGIGSVWLGTYPQMGRVERQRAIFDLPDTVIPHSIIAFGYPDEEQKPAERGDTFELNRIHVDHW